MHPAITFDDTTREAYREWLVALANSVQELMFLEEDIDDSGMRQKINYIYLSGHKTCRFILAPMPHSQDD